MADLLRRFASDEGGATAIEYGLIAAMVAVFCIAAFIAFGGSVQGLFGRVRDHAGNAMDNAGV